MNPIDLTCHNFPFHVFVMISTERGCSDSIYFSSNIQSVTVKAIKEHNPFAYIVTFHFNMLYCYWFVLQDVYFIVVYFIVGLQDTLRSF